MADVLIIMGSDSDLPVMKEAAVVLEELGVSFKISIVSAHRTPKRMFTEAQNAKKNGHKCIIAGAGGAAHLPGMTASLTELPVIGVPIRLNVLSGIDALYSIVQMPPGVPVATVAINGAKNAGLLAVQILATSNAELANKMIDYKKNMMEEVEAKAARLEKMGFADYLKEL